VRVADEWGLDVLGAACRDFLLLLGLLSGVLDDRLFCAEAENNLTTFPVIQIM
jgi:hypothetical protein